MNKKEFFSKAEQCVGECLLNIPDPRYALNITVVGDTKGDGANIIVGGKISRNEILGIYFMVHKAALTAMAPVYFHKELDKITPEELNVLSNMLTNMAHLTLIQKIQEL